MIEKLGIHNLIFFVLYIIFVININNIPSSRGSAMLASFFMKIFTGSTIIMLLFAIDKFRNKKASVIHAIWVYVYFSFLFYIYFKYYSFFLELYGDVLENIKKYPPSVTHSILTENKTFKFFGYFILSILLFFISYHIYTVFTRRKQNHIKELE